ncbi:MAG: glycosyltransferase family 1 protein [Chloroflexi bacterium]|nr:MAG: glycosyltransferase family 1 protein [Chloroflexota bacterium]
MVRGQPLPGSRIRCARAPETPFAGAAHRRATASRRHEASAPLRIIPRMDSAVRVPTLPGATFRLPPQLEGLRRLAFNLWWTWHPRAKILFSRVDGPAWTRYRNPIPVLAGPVAWSELLDNPAFMAEYQQVIREFDGYMTDGADHWFHRRHADTLSGPIAYFCAEYGFYESLGIYSGGLGVLAGDHVKSASDMALPLVAVGLMYRKGYFRQTIDADGHQEHAYPDFDLTRLPLLRVQDQEGDPLEVSVELPGRTLSVAVWLAQVGRVPVLLLDTDVPENDEADRPITHILYVRGREMRLHQELVLGVGGVRAIRGLGVEPVAWHLNEGHSAFLLAERARERATPCSRSTHRSRPATSASTSISSGASPDRSSTATTGPRRAASRSSGCSRSGAGRTATIDSST